ncbi:MAG: hypothetical protein MUF18_00125 [Fimbriiglobus sp.]|jgi:hypothetical protein|nr:hypothetical protein [Fimbriiglobus sp.]
MAATATHHDHHHEVTVPDARVDVSKVRVLSLAALAVGAAVFFIGGFVGLGTDPKHGMRDFFLAYLCGFVFWCSLPFGSLLLSMIGYLAQASWGIVFRRIFQASIRTLPLLAVLGVPVVVSVFVMGGEQSPFWWARSVWHAPTDQIPLDDEQKKDVQKYIKQGLGHDAKDIEHIATVAAAEHIPPAAAEESLHKVHDWLNRNGFAIRYVAYFAIIGVVAFLLQRQARKAEDVSDTEAERYKLHVISGPGIPVVVITLTFFVTDWVMSVEPTWASSMFPVVFGMNMFLTTFAFSTLLFYTLTKVPNDTRPDSPNRPDLTAVVKDKFRIDIGSLTLGFCMVWAYASFCQFMLIWAGNLPEEIPYYLKRGANNADSLLTGSGAENPGGNVGYSTGWVYLTYILMAFHWLLPFIVLLFREVKTSPKGMRLMALLLLAVCACDVCWWIMPSVPHPSTWLHLPMAFGAILMVGGIWAFVFAGQLKKRSILPTNSEGQFLASWGHH